jgi:hypothetical protein
LQEKCEAVSVENATIKESADLRAAGALGAATTAMLEMTRQPEDES